MRRYDAILLDADDTLLDFASAEREAIAELFAALEIADPEAPERYRAINHACWRAYERGELTQQRLRVKRFEDFLPLYGIAEDPAAVAARYLSILARQGMLLPGAENLVRALAVQRPLAIVTNGIDFVQHGRMDASPIRPFVNALVISGELGRAKPDPAIIFEALRLLGDVPPSRALMVGDSLESDMACARNAGADGCWFNPTGKAAPADGLFRYEIRSLDKLLPIALAEDETL